MRDKKEHMKLGRGSDSGMDLGGVIGRREDEYDQNTVCVCNSQRINKNIKMPT